MGKKAFEILKVINYYSHLKSPKTNKKSHKKIIKVVYFLVLKAQRQINQQ